MEACAIKMEERNNHNKKTMEVKNLSITRIYNLISVEKRRKISLKISEMSTKVDVLKIKGYQIIMMKKAMESLVKKKKVIQISHQNLIKMIDQETTLHSIQKV